MPDISVYGDGRVLTTARHLALSPVPEVVRDQRLTRMAYRWVHRDARLAGLGTSRTFDPDQQIIDGGATVVTFLADGRRHVSTVRTGASGARVWLIDRLADQLRSPARSDLVRPPATYHPARMAIVAWQHQESGSSPDSGPPRVRPWPLRPLVASQWETCTVLTGPDSDAAARLADSAPRDTWWRSGSHLYLVLFRPLLPDETDCAAVTP